MWIFANPSKSYQSLCNPLHPHKSLKIPVNPHKFLWIIYIRVHICFYLINVIKSNNTNADTVILFILSGKCMNFRTICCIRNGFTKKIGIAQACFDHHIAVYADCNNKMKQAWHLAASQAARLPNVHFEKPRLCNVSAVWLLVATRSSLWNL